MPGVRPVSAFVGVLAATGPWQAVCGAASAWYHHWPVCPAMVSVAPVAVMALAVSEAGVVKLTLCSAVVAQAESPYALYV